MKPTTVLIVFMASVALASPFVMPPADATVVSEENLVTTAIEINKASIAADCYQCSEFFGKCRSSVWCFYNPWGCYTTCNTDTCRKFNRACAPCGYTEDC